MKAEDFICSNDPVLTVEVGNGMVRIKLKVGDTTITPVHVEIEDLPVICSGPNGGFLTSPSFGVAAPLALPACYLRVVPFPANPETALRSTP